MTASVASRQQPVDRARVERQFIGLALTGASIGRHLDPHHVAFGGERHADPRANSAAATNSNPARRRQGHAQRVLQRGWLGSYRLDIVGGDHGAAHVPVFGMMLEQRQRRADAVARHQRFDVSIAASRQLPHLLQQTVQPIGIGAQSGEHAFVGNARRIDERGDRRDRRHPIAERMCQPAKQIVMYREPTRRAGVAAHV